jgi:transglutaminase-like putative cysteine protease
MWSVEPSVLFVHRYFFFLRGWLILVLGLVVAVGLPAEPGSLVISPEPGWVSAREWSMPAPDAAHLGVPAVGLLFDAQTRLGGGPSQRYARTLTLLKNGEGVRRFAEVSIALNPEYERVLVHALRVHRNGMVEDRLATAEFKTLQRETNIENQLYDGTRTFYAVLSDIRPGDILEQSYTLVGDHPLVADRVGAAHYVGGMIPLLAQSFEIRQSIDLPEPLTAWWFPPGTQGLPEAIYDPATVQARLTRADTKTERVWRWTARDLPAVPVEDGMAWRASPLLPHLRLTAFPDWESVAAWGRDRFTNTAVLPEELDRLVARWMDELPEREARIAAAVRWVQDDIRYFAFAMGENNWRPRELDAITATRFGDCKDKSLLLAALLRRLGEYAWPALVNTYARDELENLAPSPYAFNHAIVAVGGAEGQCCLSLSR